MSGRPTVGRWAALIVGLAALGIASAGYIIAHQGGTPSPFRDSYVLRVELTAADGVTPGIGQPVNVAGVQVGQITAARVADTGNAAVTLEIWRAQLPHVYANATADLEPITPLHDMQINLRPGGSPAPPLVDGARLGTSRTKTPIPLQDLLSALDGDTRAWLTSLINSLGEGTAGRGEDMRRTFLLLAPTVSQVRRISAALAERRKNLAGLVHNLGLVTIAASRDHQLATVVQAGDQTLAALAAEETPLRAALASLPGTLKSADATLGDTATFADKLRPTMTELLPVARRLPTTLSKLEPLADALTSTVGQHVRPLVAEAQPLVKDLGRTTKDLRQLAPPMTRALQSLNYLLNELAYNPPGTDEGGLFWLSWLAHNWLSTFSLEDAHGMVGRAVLMESCQTFASDLLTEVYNLAGAAFGLDNLCPGS